MGVEKLSGGKGEAVWMVLGSLSGGCWEDVWLCGEADFSVWGGCMVCVGGCLRVC